jgi:hypothetical protein
MITNQATNQHRLLYLKIIIIGVIIITQLE